MSQSVVTSVWACQRRRVCGVRTSAVVQNRSDTSRLMAIARGVWVGWALLMLGMLVVFAVYFWHWARVTPCYQPTCAVMLSFYEARGLPIELYAVLYLIALLAPPVVWIGLAIWVHLMRPHQWWSHGFSLFFLVGWYGEVNHQYIRGSLPDALRFTLTQLGLLQLAASPLTLELSLYLRGVLKMLADNLTVLMVFSFPSGRLYPRWSAVYLIVFFALSLGYSLPALRETPWNYSRWSTWPYLVVNLGLVIGLILALWQRHVSSSQTERRKVRGVLPAMIANIVVYAGISYFQGLLMPLLLSGDAVQIEVWQPLVLLVNKCLSAACMIWLALAVAQAIAKQQLFDTRFVLNRALAYSAVFASSAVLYGLIVGGLTSLVRSTEIWVSVVATGVIAVLFHPMLVLFRTAANRTFYGERHDPYKALHLLGRQLEATLKPEELSLSIVQTVAHTLRLPYVALVTGTGQTVAVGQAIGQPLEFAMLNRGQRVGALIVSSRHAGEAFSKGEMQLLEDLAARAGVAVQEASLARQLQASKEAIVLGREEERKRIRRDLHDGLGPSLASLSMQLQVTRSVMTSDPSRAEQMVLTATHGVQAAIADIRRLVYDLRPPALDDLGLGGALRQQLEQMVGVQVDAQIEDLEPLPAAVEVAAYRIACEALNNVAKHAGASVVTLRLGMFDRGLSLEVNDDGCGLPVLPNAGVGLSSMRERALELGGLLSIESAEVSGTRANGTRVSAWLPVRS